MKACWQRSSSAFTLVELLVVIGVIAVLIAMLMPALNKARESARSAQCMSNLRQMSVGFFAYAGESRGWHVAKGAIRAVAPGNPALPHSPSWARVIARQLRIKYTYEINDPDYNNYATNQVMSLGPKDNGIFQCPTEQSLFKNWYGNFPCTNSYGFNSGSLLGRCLGLDDGWNDATYWETWGRVRTNKIKRPAELLVVGDAITSSPMAEVWVELSSPATAVKYHNGGANYLFADGHVARKVPKELTAKDYQRPLNP
jgi:prepilin-type processing-associated H-X9-DG protein